MGDDEVVTIKGPSAQQYDLGPGGSLVFGSCACSDCDVQIKVSPGRGQWLRGVLRVREDHWRLDNLSPDVDFVSCDLEDRRQRVLVPARRVDVVVPFELAAVCLGSDGDEIVVFGHEPRVTRLAPCAREASDVGRVRLTPGTVYMAVLEELCRIQDADRTVPTSASIALALRGRGIETSARAVDRHIDYLYRRFYPHDAEAGGPPRSGWKRRAVASAGTRALKWCVPERQPSEGLSQPRGR